MAPGFVDHSLQPGQDPSREGFMQWVAEEHAIFSNIRYDVEELIAEGDMVISRLKVRRIHDRGEFLGLAPTGMELTTTAMVLHRIVGGKVVDEWSESTRVAEAMRQRLEQE